MYKIAFTKQASRILRKMPRNVSTLIREKLEAIAAEPYGQHNNVTKLHKRTGYRLRVGDWRVLYDIQDDETIIIVLRIGTRGGVYR